MGLPAQRVGPADGAAISSRTVSTRQSLVPMPRRRRKRGVSGGPARVLHLPPSSRHGTRPMLCDQSFSIALWRPTMAAGYDALCTLTRLMTTVRYAPPRKLSRHAPSRGRKLGQRPASGWRGCVSLGDEASTGPQANRAVNRQSSTCCGGASPRWEKTIDRRSRVPPVGSIDAFSTYRSLVRVSPSATAAV